MANRTAALVFTALLTGTAGTCAYAASPTAASRAQPGTSAPQTSTLGAAPGTAVGGATSQSLGAAPGTSVGGNGISGPSIGAAPGTTTGARQP